MVCRVKFQNRVGLCVCASAAAMPASQSNTIKQARMAIPPAFRSPRA
jgi:hypothetical protein